ncbi:desulfoferrodoxin [candidate division WOR-3 bacterium]|nr:desulfoferrodoxin [candidate division WOR-3 bacterium]
MTKKLQIYKCDICGNIVEVLHAGAEALVCCGQPMKLKDELTKEGAGEKHLPVIEKTEQEVKVKVGSVEHPMEDAHYIEWIEIQSGDKVCKKFLKPGETPQAVFKNISEGEIVAREYCNIHGLWSASS